MKGGLLRFPRYSAAHFSRPRGWHVVALDKITAIADLQPRTARHRRLIPYEAGHRLYLSFLSDAKVLAPEI